MKIALICTEKLPVPPVAGGAIQMYIDGILPHLAKEHEITVFSVNYPELPDEESAGGIRHIRLPGKSGSVYVENLKSRLDGSYDLVHVFNRPLSLLQLAESFPALKFSLSLHNEMFHREKISDDAAVKCIEKAEFINAVSRYIADTVVRRVPSAAGKTRVVYSGVDPCKYYPLWTGEGARRKREMKAKLGLAENCRVVLFVGRLSAKKGVHVLIKAMEKVMAARSDTALLVAGSKWYGGNETDEYTAYVHSLSRNLPGPVVFTGFVPPSDIPGYYCAGDVFVCASQWNEPLARVHYEAMAAGLPIITTDRGGNAEVVKGFENGIVLEAYNDPDAMAEKIGRLLDNPGEAARMGMNGRRLAEEKYSWEKVAARVLDKPPEVMNLQSPAAVNAPSDVMDTLSGTASTAFTSLNTPSDVISASSAENANVQSKAANTQSETSNMESTAFNAPSEAKAANVTQELAKTPSNKIVNIPPKGANKPDFGISVIGSGYVGLVTGVCLASTGMNVICCDRDEEKISELKKGILPIYEPCLESLFGDCAFSRKTLLFTTDIKFAVDNSDIIFITVNTPALENGMCDTSRVFEAAADIAKHMAGFKTIVIKSTVPVGTGRKVKEEIQKILDGRSCPEAGFDIVSNPEFLREGTAVEDFINPDRIVVGAENGRAAETMRKIYHEQIAGDIPMLITGIDTAEMIKYASNAFLATKISFINEIANICELCGVNAARVAEGIGLDRRIGRQFLNPGPGFGGSCFPKDVRVLSETARKFGYDPLLLDSVIEVNKRQKKRMINKIENVLGGLEGRRISVLGLAFKPGTDDIRESPSLTILPALLEKKARVSVYDPQAMGSLKRAHPELAVEYCDNPYSACEGSECVVLATEWKDLTGLDFERLKSIVKNRVFIDLRNAYEPEDVKKHGFYYEGVGVK